MIKKIVYISYLPLTRKMFGDFFMDELQQSGFEVEYLDVTTLFHSIDVEEMPSEIVCKINSYQELRQYLRNQNKQTTLFISQITFEWRCLKLYRYLTLEKCLLGRFANNMLPTPPCDFKRFIWRLFTISPCTYLNSIKQRFAIMLKRWGYIKSHEIIFSGGELGFQTIGAGANIDMHKGCVIQINSADYGMYQDLKNTNKKIIDSKYIVFLDEYLPFHPDFELLGIKTIEPEQYYRELNRFFDEIEQKYNIQVVIAAHPKALKYRDRIFFNSRKVIFGETASLVRDCEFVLAHGSTSCGFAAMFSKSITILSSESIAQTMPVYHKCFEFFATTFGGKFLSYDQPLSEEIYQPANTGKYDEYRYKFLTSPQSENRKTLDIIVDFLKKYPL